MLPRAHHPCRHLRTLSCPTPPRHTLSCHAAAIWRTRGAPKLAAVQRAGPAARTLKPAQECGCGANSNPCNGRALPGGFLQSGCVCSASPPGRFPPQTLSPPLAGAHPGPIRTVKQPGCNEVAAAAQPNAQAGLAGALTGHLHWTSAKQASHLGRGSSALGPAGSGPAPLRRSRGMGRVAVKRASHRVEASSQGKGVVTKRAKSRVGQARFMQAHPVCGQLCGAS